VDMQKLLIALALVAMVTGVEAQTAASPPTKDKDITITLTEQEANVLEQMLDQAVKSIGLRAAEAGAVLNRKLQVAKAAAQGTSVAQGVPGKEPAK
jgi:hypothetical protein